MTTIIEELARLLPEMTDATLYAVLVRSRLLLLRECVIAQYGVERRAWYRVRYPNAHWVR